MTNRAATRGAGARAKSPPSSGGVGPLAAEHGFPLLSTRESRTVDVLLDGVIQKLAFGYDVAKGRVGRLAIDERGRIIRDSVTRAASAEIVTGEVSVQWIPGL